MYKSILFHKQEALGAVFGEYGQWQLPSSYGSYEEEVRAAQTACGLLDRCDLGQVKLTGADHLDLLHRITTNEVRHLRTGDSLIDIFANEKGRIVDRVLLLKIDSGTRLVTSAGHAGAVADWLDRFIFIEDVAVRDLQHAAGALGLYGPRSSDVLRSVFTDVKLPLSDSCFQQIAWNGQPVILQPAVELSVAGFNLFGQTEILPELWDLLLAVGGHCDLQPVGHDALEVLRIEAGWPEFGKDFGDHVNPHEAGMISYVNFDKGCYVGQEVIARLDTYDKVQKRLTGIHIDGTNPAATGDSILMGDEDVGVITSSTYSPTLSHAIAMGYVRSRAMKEKPDHEVHTVDGKWTGRLTALPFVKRAA